MDLPIIKSAFNAGRPMRLGEATPGPRGDAPLAIDDAPARAAAEQARLRQAVEAEIRQTLEREYTDRFEAARQGGFDQGFKEGLEAGHEEGLATGADAFSKKTFLLEQILSKAEHAVDAWQDSVQRVATEVAFELTGRLLVEHALEPSLLSALTQKVMAGLREPDVLSIRLHPAECQVLRQALKQGSAAVVPSRIAAKLQEDSTLAAGGVVVETPRGDYRAGLDTLLSRLLALLSEQRAALSDDHDPMVPHAIRA